MEISQCVKKKKNMRKRYTRANSEVIIIASVLSPLELLTYITQICILEPAQITAEHRRKWNDAVDKI